MAAGYDTPYRRFSRPYQFLRIQLWTASCANVTCPSAMQDGAARLLQTHLETPALAARLSDEEKRVFQNAFDHLVSRDTSYAWTSGQWMTERSGGSDVSLTETTAVLKPTEQVSLASKRENIPLGPWSINGFKWFSSATDSKMTVLLARTPSGGISTFMAPMRKHAAHGKTSTGRSKADGQVLNGVRIQRLKDKSGTQPLPTAELVLENMRGWLVGREGRGIHEVGTVLNLTRVHSTVAAVGYVGRGLAMARAYALVRDVGAGRGRRVRLVRNRLHVRTLAGMAAEYRRLMLLAMFTASVLGVTEHPEEDAGPTSEALRALTPRPALAAPLLRVLTQLSKAYVCQPAVSLLSACVESLGGVGYLANSEQEYLNVSRLHRDCAVLPIWEGTTDVLSTDFVRALKHPKGGSDSLDALGEVIRRGFAVTGGCARPEGWDPVREWDALRGRIEGESAAELTGDARRVLWRVGDLLVAVLLYVDAGTDGDAAARDIFYRFVQEKGAAARSGEDGLERDLAIVYGGLSTEDMSKL